MGIQLIDEIRDQIDSLVKACRDAAVIESNIQRTYIQVRETGLSIYEIILTLSGVSAALPDEIADAIKDQLKIDLSDLTELADGFLDMNLLTNTIWQTLLTNEQTVMDAFVQRFADYMLVYVNREEDEMRKFVSYVDGIEETVRLLEDELKIYEYGTIRSSLQAAISELQSVLGYIDSALNVLSYSRTPSLAVSTEIIGRYEKVQDILSKSIDSAYEQAKKYHFDGDLVWELMQDISGYVQKMVESIAKFLIYDAAIKNARIVLIYMEDIVDATIGAAERYVMESYLESQRDDLASLINKMSTALNEYKFEPRLLGTSVVAYGNLAALKNKWLDGQIAEMFSQHYQARAAVVAFTEQLANHNYFAETQPQVMLPASEMMTGLGKIASNGLQNLVEIGDGRMFKAGYSMIENFRFRVSEVDSSIRGLKGTLESYGRFEDTTGTLDSLDSFFQRILSVNMIDFILGMSGAIQIANLLLTFNFTDSFQGIIGEPLVRLAGLRLKAVADTVIRGEFSVEESMALERSQLDTLSRERETDLSISEAYVNRKAELKKAIDTTEKSVEEYEYLLNKGLI